MNVIQPAKLMLGNSIAAIRKRVLYGKARPIEHEPGQALAPWRFQCTKNHNTVWARSDGGKRLTILRQPLIAKSTKIFALGSCFALEIRDALAAHGFDTYPKWSDIEYDPERQQPGPNSKGRRHPAEAIAHYDTNVIRQEIERAISKSRWGKDDMWQVDGTAPGRPEWRPHFRNPYMRKVSASNLNSLMEISDRVSRCVDDGLETADLVIITLGLTECFRNKSNGYWIAQGTLEPRNPTSELNEFHISTFAETYDNLNIIADHILSLGKSLMFTVSPVPMARTWTGQDVVHANTISKTTLRAAVGQLCRERPEILYWPSFEVCWNRDIYRAMGGLHPHPQVVREIISGFLDAYSI